MIATMSILLTTSIFTAEAKSFDKDAAVTVKGDGVIIQSKQDSLFIAPLDDNKGNLHVKYTIQTDVGEYENGFDCTGPSKILKLSGLLKASIEFNTRDLDCLTKSDNHGDISITIQTSEPSVFNKYDDSSCTTLLDGTEVCSRIRGTSDDNQGEAKGTVFGKVLEEGTSASISKINEKRTYWTNP
jgi:hypothetical protein